MTAEEPQNHPDLDDWGYVDGPTEPNPLVFIIGAGMVGTLLAGKLTRAGVPVAGLHGRKSELSDAASALAGVVGTSGELPEILAECDVVVVAVRDTRVPEVAERLVKEGRLKPHHLVLHTSGSRPASEALAGVRGHVRGVGTLHPLVAITDAPSALDNLRGAAFGIEGDEQAVRAALRLVREMGGRPLRLRPETMALYHAGAVMASNYVVALADLARGLFVEAGVPEEDALPAVLPLLGSAVRNLVEVGLPSALTGPVVRGDVVSVERHLEAIATSTPPLLDLYRRLGQEVLRIARTRVTELGAEEIRRFSDLFAGRDPAAPRG
jgi:predicted short-subunit dehydrogenase-like oxidoreductase (DUF2520 family)